jgi:GNAT superfamily N-acetyltransferase
MNIVRQRPSDKEIDRIITWIKLTQNITGYTHGEIQNCDEIFLAFVGAELAGAVINTHQSKSISELAVLVVGPDFQGQGIGKKLFETALKSLENESRTVWCVSRNPIVLHYFRIYNLELTSFWKLPAPVLWYNLTFVLNLNRIKEFFRKKMYDRNLKSFEYGIKTKI